MNQRTTMYLKTLSISIVFALTACGGASQQVVTNDGGPKKVTTAPKADGTPKDAPEDLTKRSEVKERIIKYVEGVEKKAQDYLREGLTFALKSPPDYPKAREKFEDAIDEDSGFREAYTNLGKVYEKERRLEKAKAVYERALRKLGDKTETLDFRAHIAKLSLINARQAKALGKITEYDRLLNEGKSLLDNVDARDSENVAGNNSLALYWLMKDDLDKAEEFVVRVLARDPANTAALNTRGLINLKRGNLRVARWIFAEKVLSLDPNSVEAHTNVGVCYVRLGSLPSAVVSFNKALKLDPANVPATMNLASVQLNWLDYASAIKGYTFVLEQRPDNVEAMLGLAFAQWGAGEYKDSISSFSKAYNVDKRKSEVLLHIAKIYESHLDKMDEAIAALREYMGANQMGPDSDIGKRIKMMLDMKKMQEEAEAEEKANANKPKEDDAEEGGDDASADGADETSETPADTDEKKADETPADAAPETKKEEPAPAPKPE